jgi:signal peptidase I
MLKYFILEAYQIPSGSMQPTLMGNDETGIKDRILVDKLSFHFRDPERFEVVVFKYPLDRSKNFIKRVCGMPGEQLRISYGDLWTRKDSSEQWTILRRPQPVQREVWKRLDRDDARFERWKPDGGARTWTLDGRSTVLARGDGSVRLPSDGGSVMDNYRDGYPGKMARALARGRGYSGSHPVGDLRVECDVRALPGCKAAVVELQEGNRRYRFELPGPAADASASPIIRTSEVGGGTKPLALDAKASQPWKLAAHENTSIAVQNMDDRLALEIDGDIVVELDIPMATDQSSAFVLRSEGEGVDFTEIELFRDIHYLDDNVRTSEFEIPAGHYVMLGDNTQDSSDSRDWSFVRYRWPGEGSEGAIVRGNMRGNNENPTEVAGGAEGIRVFLRDEWGELHTFPGRTATKEQTEPAPLVARTMITGRAVAGFWPFVPSLNVWRLQWIH